ncbi:MAG: S9 family peptidase [Bacteroidetes bacterium]|nr:S9 family peptidase [Bacteroidota bacterium]MBU2586351.1 S9 family peptidase [Bacteroidota bacterium]
MNRLNKIFTIFLLFVSVAFAQNGTKKFTIEEIYGSMKFMGKSLRGVQWIAGGEKFTYLETDTSTRTTDIWVYNIKNKKRNVFLKASELKLEDSDKPFSIMNYSFSPNERYILFTGMLPARALKSGGVIYIYDLKEKRFSEIETSGSTMNVKFSEDGTKLGYVTKDNIYVYDLSSQTERQLTHDGNGVILNGHFDWVYEEEFSIIDGWQFSPDGNEIAFWRLDQSPVPEIEIQQFDSLYFNSIKMRYPKAGDKNSIVKIGVIELKSGLTTWMDSGNETDVYIPRIRWTENPGVLSITRMNRLQNKLELLFADSKSGKSKVIYTDTDSCWVDVEDANLIFLKDRKHFLITSERSGYKHFYLYDLNGKMIRQITKGNWEVTSLSSFDEKNQVIYFISGMNDPTLRHLYKIKLNGKGLERITKDDGNNSINFSPNSKYFIRSFSNINSVTKIQLESSDGKLIEVLVDNEQLKNTLEEYAFAPPEFLSFSTSDGVQLNAMIIKPKDFDPSKKYPVLVYNYSGPGSQIVRNAWQGGQYLWYQMLAQEGYIIFMLDNRGTGGRGKSFKNIVYKNLGHWEVNDQIEGAKYLITLPYVDGERIGIWGWSYGGYISALTIMEGNEYFKSAVAVASVTDWKFYDTIYTERYMSTPQLNPDGYERGSILNKVDKLKGKLLLIHGTADDNVHFQNTVVLVEELVKANKQFQVMFYPGKNHGISGGKTREQLFTMITNFIRENL